MIISKPILYYHQKVLETIQNASSGTLGACINLVELFEQSHGIEDQKRVKAYANELYNAISVRYCELIATHYPAVES